ncbi:MAG: DUF120 domain-containing protein, partial [Desulfobacterales bacterium]
SGKAFPVSLGSIRAAIIMPAKEVRVHGENIIELISGVKLKDALSVDDGDYLELTVEIAKPRII